MAAANILSHAAVNRTRDDVLASGRVVPFHGFVELLQEHINFISTFIDLHCPIQTELLLVIFPFLVGFVRVMWPIVRSAMYNYRARRKKLVVRDIVSVTAPVYRTNGLPTDRNAFLQNAIFMYLSKVVWEKKPIPASEWRNKSSVLLLLDPFRSRIYERSDSPFQIDDSSSDDDGDLAFSNVARSSKKLQRLLLVKLPVGGAWVDTQDELRIEMGYKRQRINIASVVGVERTLSLRARGPDAAQRIETFTQRCLAHFIARIPDMSRNTRNYYELQPSKSGGLLGGGGGGSDGESKMLFKRYPLTDEKNLDTMFFPEKEQVMKFVDDFLFHRGRFAVEGFPYKLGFLLHGPPGSGKTAFVKALAAYTGRHIMSVPLHAVETNQQLYDVFLNRAFTCVGDSETQTMQLDDVIFLLDDVDASSPLVCSRQRRRAIKRRKPAVLTAKEASPEETQRRRQRAEQRQKRREQQNKGDGKDGSRGEDDEEFDDDQDETEEDLEDHIVELQERKYGLSGGSTDDASSAAAMNSLLSAMGVVPGAASKEGTTSVSPRDKSVSQGASTQNLMSLGMGNDMATGGSGSASATAGGGAGGKLTAFDNSGAAGGFARDGKKSLFSLFESADKLDLSGLLNVLDGVVDTPGRIVVMITNHPERLDPALVRPGRMSTRLRLDYIQFDALTRMAGLHFGLQEPTPESQDVVRIAEKLEAQIAEDHHAMQAARRYRALQTKADSELAAELADDDDVDAGTTRTSTSGEAGKTAISSSTKSDDVDVVKESETGMTLLEKPVAIPSGVAAARVARRTLSESQIKVLRARIAALEAEAQAWKREHGDDAASATTGSGEKGKMNSANGGESPQIRQSPAPDSASAGSKGVTDAPTNSPYNFHITPSEVEMMCSQTETLEEFMDMLSQVIRGELRL